MKDTPPTNLNSKSLVLRSARLTLRVCLPCSGPKRLISGIGPCSFAMLASGCEVAPVKCLVLIQIADDGLLAQFDALLFIILTFLRLIG